MAPAALGAMGASLGCVRSADADELPPRAQRVQACPWNPDAPNAKPMRAKKCGA